MRYGRTTAGLLAVAALTLAACGDDADDTDDGEDATTEDGEAEQPASGTDDDLYGTGDDSDSDEATADGEDGADDGAAAGDVDVQVSSTDLGDVLVDGEGNTLYGFTDDTEGTPTCEAECADAWPAAPVDGEPTVSGDLDAEVFSVVDALDGGSQLVAGDWPLYTFSGDAAPGDVNGQGVGGVWYVVAPDGTLIED